MHIETNVRKHIHALKELIQNKDIIIFGAGEGGAITQEALLEERLTASYYLDNDSKLWGQEQRGLKIKRPEELMEEEYEKIIVLISSMYYKVIFPKLRDLGIPSSCIYYILADVLYGEKEFEQIESEKERIRQINRSSQVYRGVKVGRYTYGHQKLIDQGLIKSIGSFCSINSTVLTGRNHPTAFISTSPVFYHTKETYFNHRELIGLLEPGEEPDLTAVAKNTKIVIGNDVWIGASTVLLPNITIGNGAIIGAGAIVTRNVPDFAVVVGVPAKVLRYRFNIEQIEILKKVKWWDWPEDKLKEHRLLFGEMDTFFDTHEKGLL